MRFNIPAPLLRALRAARDDSSRIDPIMHIEDAFLLDPGLGPAAYLTADGRVIIEYHWWDDSHSDLREADDDDAITAIVVGAKKTGLVGLLALLPPPPLGAHPCQRCAASRWAVLKDGTIVCWECHGRGWVE